VHRITMKNILNTAGMRNNKNTHREPQIMVSEHNTTSNGMDRGQNTCHRLKYVKLYSTS